MIGTGRYHCGLIEVRESGMCVGFWFVWPPFSKDILSQLSLRPEAVILFA